MHPIIGRQDGGCWSVIGIHGGSRVQAERSGRRDAWAEAVRLALMAATDRSPGVTALSAGTMAGPPDDPTACDGSAAG